MSRMALDRAGVKPYLSRFTRFLDERRDEPGWLRTRREEAMARFASAGFPTSKDEAWRATPVASLVRTEWQESPAPPAEALRERVERHALDGTHRLVFVNGRFVPDLSDSDRLPEGLAATGLAEALRTRPDAVRDALEGLPGPGEQRLGDLNAAFATDGAFVELPAGKVIDEPIHLLFLTEG